MRIPEVPDMLAVLGERERKIVEMYYGLDGNDPLLMYQIAVKFKVTTGRIQQIIARARRKMRAAALDPEIKGLVQCGFMEGGVPTG